MNVIRWFSLLALACLVSACAAREEDLSLATEAQLLSSYMQAANCIVLKASDEEKTKLMQGMPYLDRSTSAGADLGEVVRKRIVAEDFLYEVLPKRCPDASRRIVFWSDQLDGRNVRIFEAHFVDVVSMAVSMNASSLEDLKNYFEHEHTPIGDTVPQY